MSTFLPIEYTFQPSPLIFIQGLGKDGVPQGSSKDLSRSIEPEVHQNPLLANPDTITRKQETVRASSGLEFVSMFKKHILPTDCIWVDDLMKSQIDAPVAKLNIKFIGNEVLLPKYVNDETTITESSDESADSGLHTPTNSFKSPLSPFNESSDLFPDGIISANWIQKYKEIVPAVFISIHELNSDLHDDEQKQHEESLIDEIKYLKTQITLRGIRFISVLVSSRSTALNPELVEKVSRIKKLTGLQSKNSLLFLPSGSERELRAFVNHVVSLLRPLSTDFYNLVEKKIKRKKSRQSSAQLSTIPQGLLQPFWDTRYFTKLAMIAEFKSQVDVALKNWEQSYASLLEIFKSLQRDNPRWAEFRRLLDFILFHIVKNILYLEDCNLAFTRFDLHLQNVITFLKKHDINPRSYSVLTWISKQFIGFAELLDYLPREIIPINEPYALTTTFRLSMPNPGYLFLQAVTLTEKRRSQATIHPVNEYIDTYLSLPIEEELSHDYNTECMYLLKKGLAFFNKSGAFQRTEMFVKFEMARYQQQMKQYQEALELYKDCQDYLSSGKYIGSYISFAMRKGVYDCALMLNDNKQAILSALDMATLPTTFEKLELSLKEESNIIHSDARIAKLAFTFRSAEASTSEPCDCQLTIQWNLNELFARQFTIDSIELEFEDGSSISPLSLRNDSNISPHKLQIIEGQKRNDKYVYAANLNPRDDFQVINFKGIVAERIGKSTLQKNVKVYGSYQEFFKVEFTIQLSADALNHRQHWYTWNSSSGSLRADYFKSKDPLTVKILPRRPNIIVKPDETTCFVGELASLPINVKNDDHESVTITLKANTSSLAYFQHKTLEEEEKSLTFELTPSSSADHRLLVPISLAFKEEAFMFTLEVSYYAADNSEVPIQDSIPMSLAVMQPLKSRLTILPRYRETDMPSCFTPQMDQREVPIPTRYWCARSTVVAHNDIHIVDTQLLLEHSEEYVSGLDTETKVVTTNSDSLISDINFYTRSGDGAIRREIPLSLRMKINWKRKGSDKVNEYLAQPFETSLSLFDPRVLLISSEKDSQGVVHLVYALENPAPRIFQFSCSQVDNEGSIVGGDLKNNTFPLLPFTRQKLRYAVKLKKGDKLPSLRVYDLQYKVHLPILFTNDSFSLEGRYMKTD